MDDIEEEWDKLCAEHDAARDAFFEAFAPVRQSFSESGRTVPCTDDLARWEEAEDAWKDVIRRIHEFVQAHSHPRK